jgi:hypothetical protein
MEQFDRLAEEDIPNNSATVTSPTISKPSNATGSTTLFIWLVVVSVLLSSANLILYKATLNSFSSATTNYGFFVSQFSSLFYVIPAILFSVVLIIKDYQTFKDAVKIPHRWYLFMALLDSASAIMGAIAGTC